MKLKKLAALMLTGAVALTSASAMAKTYKLASNVPADGPPGQLLQEFASRVTEDTDGRVKIKVFANGTLGGQAQYLQQVQSGVIQMGLVNSAMMENIEPKFGVLNLPYIYRSFDEFKTVMDSDLIQDELFSSTADKGFKIVGFLDNGPRSIYSTKPIDSVDDLKGLKLRVMSSPTYIEMLELMGTAPTPLDFSEIYSALQQGMIDGGEGGLGALWEIKFGEHAKYAIKSEQTRMVDLIIINDKALSKMKPADAETVKRIMQEVTEKSYDVVRDQEAESLKLAQEKLGVKIVEIDKAPLVASMAPIYDRAMEDPDKGPMLKKVFELQGREF